MGFSVYGRMGGNVDSTNTSYGKDSHYPKVIVSKSSLGPRYATQRTYYQPANNVTPQSYNPKKTAQLKKENKGLKTALLVAGAATVAYLCRKPIEGCLKAVRTGVSKAVGPTIEKVSKVTIGDACKAPGKVLKNLGGAIAKPFVAIGKFFTKKPTP